MGPDADAVLRQDIREFLYINRSPDGPDQLLTHIETAKLMAEVPETEDRDPTVPEQRLQDVLSYLNINDWRLAVLTGEPLANVNINLLEVLLQILSESKDGSYLTGDIHSALRLIHNIIKHLRDWPVACRILCANTIFRSRPSQSSDGFLPLTSHIPMLAKRLITKTFPSLERDCKILFEMNSQYHIAQYASYLRKNWPDKEHILREEGLA